MKQRKVMLLTVFLFFLVVGVASALSEPFWVMGQISTAITEVMYETTRYYSFNLVVYDCSGGHYDIGQEIPVIMNISEANVALVQGGWYNFTGRINEVQVDEVPQGVFIIDSISIELEDDILIMIFRKIVDVVSGVVAGIVDTIVQLVFIGTGFEVPRIIVTGFLVLSCLFFLLKFYKHIGLLLVLVLAFLVISGVFNAVRLVWI